MELPLIFHGNRTIISWCLLYLQTELRKQRLIPCWRASRVLTDLCGLTILGIARPLVRRTHWTTHLSV